MADLATLLKNGVTDILSRLGSQRTLRLITESAINPSDPGAAPTETDEDIPLNCKLFQFEEKYMPNANVLDGDTMALLDIDGLTQVQMDQIVPGNKIVDGSNIYVIVKSKEVEAAGVPINYILQLKG